MSLDVVLGVNEARGLSRRKTIKSFRQRMSPRDDELDDDLVETFQQQLDEETADIDEVDAAVRGMATTLSRKRKIM